jgi:4-hydroxy-2-oxoheptanedioate aldolase
MIVWLAGYRHNRGSSRTAREALVYRPNPLKKRLKEGRRSFGCWLGLGSPIATEVLAQIGYDFLLIDNEHGPWTLSESVGLLQAMAGTPTASVMRVPWNDPVYLKRALDIGVEAVMIPAINTADQAVQAVRACRYPPQGFRGSAYQVVRAANYGIAGSGIAGSGIAGSGIAGSGIGGADYRETAADNLVIICQVESKQAVDQIDEIAAVEGIDVLFMGPNDLAGTVGRLGDLKHPEVMALVERAERAIKAAGKRLGGIAYGGWSAADMFERGYDMVLASTDMTLMREAALSELRAHRARFGEK